MIVIGKVYPTILTIMDIEALHGQRYENMNAGDNLYHIEACASLGYVFPSLPGVCNINLKFGH
jgi:hypothetical protein